MTEIKKIKILSAVKMLAVMAFTIGALNSIFAVVTALIAKQNLLTGTVPVLFFVAFPFIYAVVGASFGAILAFFYNIFAKLFGGIIVETESK